MLISIESKWLCADGFHRKWREYLHYITPDSQAEWPQFIASEWKSASFHWLRVKECRAFTPLICWPLISHGYAEGKIWTKLVLTETKNKLISPDC